jgi:hypothetical protein
MLWTKADDAGCGVGMMCTSWKDNSMYRNPVEALGSMTLQAGNGAHNFHPYFTNFSANNFFYDVNSFNSSRATNQPISVFAVAKPNRSDRGTIIAMDDTNNGE